MLTIRKMGRLFLDSMGHLELERPPLPSSPARRTVATWRELRRVRNYFIPKILLLFPLFLASLCPAWAEDKAELEKLIPVWESYVEKARVDWKVPSVAAAVVTPEGIFWWKGFGERAHAKGAPDLHTAYAIGSTTKAFAAATLAIMVDEGGPGWDARVSDHLPEFQMFDPWVTREFRVADLLAQHPGIPTQALSGMGAVGYPPERIAQALRWVEPTSSFRTQFNYVNSPHIFAGQLVAQWAGKADWQAFLQERLLQPLSMTRTTWTGLALSGDPNHAAGHVRVKREVRVVKPGPFPYNFGPAGGLNSTLSDLSHWLRLQMGDGEYEGKRLVSEANLRYTHRPQTVVTPEMFYGMGWLKHFRGSHQLIWHNGGTPGHTTWIGFQPDRKVAVIVLSDLGGTQMPDAVGYHFFDLLNGSEGLDYSAQFLKAHRANEEQTEKMMKPPAGAKPPLSQDSLSGRYSSPALGEIKVEAGQLHLLDTGYVAKLVPYDGAIFQLDFTDPWMREAGWNLGGVVRFTSSLLGEIEGLEIVLGDPGDGAKLKAEKI